MTMITRSSGKRGAPEKIEESRPNDGIVHINVQQSNVPSGKKDREGPKKKGRSCLHDIENHDLNDNNPGQEVLYNKLIRDELLSRLNPWKLRDLQIILELRCFKGLLSDVDIREVLFKKMWGFEDDDFCLSGWRDMQIESVREKVKGAHKVLGEDTFPVGLRHPDKLQTKMAIMKEYGHLEWCPCCLYEDILLGINVLKKVLTVKGFKELYADKDEANISLQQACRVGLDTKIVCMMINQIGANIKGAIEEAAAGGHADLVDLLHRCFGAKLHAGVMTRPASYGHVRMIDHLVQKYGMDPNVQDNDGDTALMLAAFSGRVDTVRIEYRFQPGIARPSSIPVTN